MKVYKITDSAELPEFATKGSAAFDLKVCLEKDTKVRAFNPHNRETFFPTKLGSNGKYFVSLQPQFRILLPTGLIFDIPDGHVIKLHIRSSMALKFGLHLANDVAIIDSDYVDETFMMIINQCDTPIAIYSGDRLAQGLLEKTERYSYGIEETAVKPQKKTERAGGLGSTGISAITIEPFIETVDEKVAEPVKNIGGRKPKVATE